MYDVIIVGITSVSLSDGVVLTLSFFTRMMFTSLFMHATSSFITPLKPPKRAISLLLSLSIPLCGKDIQKEMNHNSSSTFQVPQPPYPVVSHSSMRFLSACEGTHSCVRPSLSSCRRHEAERISSRNRWPHSAPISCCSQPTCSPTRTSPSSSSSSPSGER